MGLVLIFETPQQKPRIPWNESFFGWSSYHVCHPMAWLQGTRPQTMPQKTDNLKISAQDANSHHDLRWLCPWHSSGQDLLRTWGTSHCWRGLCPPSKKIRKVAPRQLQPLNPRISVRYRNPYLQKGHLWQMVKRDSTDCWILNTPKNLHQPRMKRVSFRGSVAFIKSSLPWPIKINKYTYSITWLGILNLLKLGLRHPISS